MIHLEDIYDKVYFECKSSKLREKVKEVIFNYMEKKIDESQSSTTLMHQIDKFYENTTDRSKKVVDIEKVADLIKSSEQLKDVNIDRVINCLKVGHLYNVNPVLGCTECNSYMPKYSESTYDNIIKQSYQNICLFEWGRSELIKDSIILYVYLNDIVCNEILSLKGNKVKIELVHYKTIGKNKYCIDMEKLFEKKI